VFPENGKDALYVPAQIFDPLRLALRIGYARKSRFENDDLQLGAGEHGRIAKSLYQSPPRSRVTCASPDGSLRRAGFAVRCQASIPQLSARDGPRTGTPPVRSDYAP